LVIERTDERRRRPRQRGDLDRRRAVRGVVAPIAAAAVAGDGQAAVIRGVAAGVLRARRRAIARGDAAHAEPDARALAPAVAVGRALGDGGAGAARPEDVARS